MQRLTSHSLPANHTVHNGRSAYETQTLASLHELGLHCWEGHCHDECYTYSVPVASCFGDLYLPMMLAQCGLDWQVLGGAACVLRDYHRYSTCRCLARTVLLQKSSFP